MNSTRATYNARVAEIDFYFKALGRQTNPILMAALLSWPRCITGLLRNA
jgi:hypothetical protein